MTIAKLLRTKTDGYYYYSVNKQLEAFTRLFVGMPQSANWETLPVQYLQRSIVCIQIRNVIIYLFKSRRAWIRSQTLSIGGLINTPYSLKKALLIHVFCLAY